MIEGALMHLGQMKIVLNRFHKVFKGHKSSLSKSKHIYA